VVEGAIRPEERVKICRGRHRRSSLQANVLQNLIAAGLALVIKLLRCLFERIEHDRIRWRYGVFCGVEPLRERSRAGMVASRRLPARWNLYQIEWLGRSQGGGLGPPARKAA
jgi:hypothetical protein